MIEIVAIKEFDQAIYVTPGDTLHVRHEYGEMLFGKVTRKVHEVSMHNIEEHARWTHSILFRLNGHLNHLIGDGGTVEWLIGLAGVPPQ